ncbi:hypothetical protein O7632_07715 [Solwaraspora sp. WMMD406]|uniref:hypothetical protein n=1 Tax=Solwaraspora sp. WMMD406 TaxID=3016095 RepID=UPI00241796A3|nr:hypothetical protein [Solwaraspora sp. WMMD406]MDG4763993.1 hypothetical protein [Solwaraspora sp. WMMD406]
MTQLRVLAPVVVDYYGVPGASLRDPFGYARFWADQQRSVDALLTELAPAPPATSAPAEHTPAAPAPAKPAPAPAKPAPAPAKPAPAAPAAPASTPAKPAPPPAVRLEHVHPTSSLNLYRTISDHAVERPVHLLTGALTPHHLPDEFGKATSAAAQAIRDGVIEISFRLYDHGLVLLEILTDVGRWLAEQPDEVTDRLDAMQVEAVSMGERAAREIVSRYLDPVLGTLRRADRAGRFILPAAPADDPIRAEFGEALWVTRSLIVDPESPVADQMVRHWIKDVVSADDPAPADRLLNGDCDHLVRWLNYLFMDRARTGGRMLPGDPFRDQWDALRHAQVFYGVLDRIDARLSRILADSAAATSRWDFEQLKGRLAMLSQRAELIIMEQRDLAKYLKRSVRAEMDSILDFWDCEQLLEQPVRFKIELCDRRLGEMAARRTARSAMFTDLILLGIAVTSILGTALAVTEFGRAVAADPGMAVYDLGRSTMVGWVAAQPADAILIASGALSVLLVVLYLFFRRDNSP